MNIYSLRREKLMKALGDNSCVMLFSGKEIYSTTDETFPFEVNRNFYYLTGLEKADMVLVLMKLNGVVREMIYVLPYSAFAAKWFGGRMPKEEVKEISEIENVFDLETLDDQLSSYISRSRGKGGISFYFDLWKNDYNQNDNEDIKYAKKLESLYPGIIIKDLFPIITRMRLIKDDYEIACIKQALQITKSAYEAMLRGIKPGMNELMMEAIFDYSLKANMCKKLAFGTIAASGKNATTLHYRDNNQIMNDGDLFLCDCGATFKNYCADISRTFPVNGKFSPRQKEIYEIVLKVQKLVKDNAKPGITIRELNNMVIDFYKNELPLHGLNKDVSEYYMHSISHHLGLDTHDVDGGLGATLEVGNVITNEPGLYIEDEDIGIRIENDLLITENGCEDLAEDLIREVDEIESFMAKN